MQQSSAEEGRVLDTLSVQAETTIFVDLDGTLIRSDLLWETLFLTARQNPLQLLKVPGWALAGKARLKAELAEACDFDASTLPYRRCVVEALTRAKSDGRRIVLATGANAKLAHAVADHLGLFDDVMASCDEVNLTAERKLERIRAETGGAGFDYYGNSREDLCLLEHAELATVVSPDRMAARWQARTGSERMDDEGGKWRPALKALRPHQWMKNVLIFVPLALNHEFFDLTLVAGAMLAFVSFSFAASAVYLINDLLDLTADRRHKTKRNRPFASGTLSIPTGLAMAAGLLAVSVAISTVLPFGFFVVMCGYMVTTTAYSFVLKRMLLVDVMTLAALYSFRIIAGSEATAVDASFWLLAFAMFFFLSLALVKRYTELQDFGEGADRSTTGRGYVDGDLETLAQAGMASGFASVMVLALYIDSAEVKQNYSEPYFVWPLCPLVLYIIVRIWILARRNQMHDDPVLFILNDWRSQLMIAIGAVMFMIAAYV